MRDACPSISTFLFNHYNVTLLAAKYKLCTSSLREIAEKTSEFRVLDEGISSNWNFNSIVSGSPRSISHITAETRRFEERREEGFRVTSQYIMYKYDMDSCVTMKPLSGGILI
jgi:hypothetical protein